MNYKVRYAINLGNLIHDNFNTCYVLEKKFVDEKEEIIKDDFEGYLGSNAYYSKESMNKEKMILRDKLQEDLFDIIYGADADDNYWKYVNKLDDCIDRMIFKPIKYKHTDRVTFTLYMEFEVI